MILLIFITVVFILCIAFLVTNIVLRNKRAGQSTGFKDASWVMFAVGCFFTLILFIATCTSYSDQISDRLDIDKLKKIEMVKKTRAEAIIVEFAKHVSAYATHEKGVFENISPRTMSIYLVKYPELQASKTVMKLVEQVSILWDEYYKVQTEIIETEKDLSFRPINPWIINSVIPKYVLN